VNGPLFWRTIAANRVRLVLCAIGLAAWGLVLPMMYATFGKDMARLLGSNPMFEQFSRFGGGDLFSLHGAIALGFIHPFTLLLMGIMAIGYPAIAIAGERQRGTLEVLLARPISRHRLYLTLLVAGLLFLGVLLAIELGANALSATIMGVGGDLAMGQLPWLWLNGWLLFSAYLAIAFAASVSFDRLPPALGVPLIFLLLNYLADVIGSLWPDASWLRDWSLFHLVKAQPVLQGTVTVSDFAVLAAIAAIAVGYAWVAFPRRDLAAPS
jgi:ABC-type transport system involved in multi-copper enzyme maturation permease subunit